MLILTRKIGEELMIGDDIRVKVIDIKGGRVRLGFAAPREIIINRSELDEKLRLATQDAKSTAVVKEEK